MDLDSLVAMVTEKTGIEENKAKMAIEVVLNQVKEKLPSPAQGYIDSMMSTEPIADGSETIGISDAISGFSAMLSRDQ